MNSNIVGSQIRASTRLSYLPRGTDNTQITKDIPCEVKITVIKGKTYE